MDKAFDWTEPLLQSYSRMLQGLLEYLPQLLTGLGLLVIGWFIARAARGLSVRLAGNVDRLVVRLVPGLEPRPAETAPHYASVVGDVVFWIIVLLFVASATNVLGLRLFTGWLDGIINYLPTILSGVLIIVAGIVIGNLARNAVTAAAASAGYEHSALLGRLAQTLALVTLVTVGIDQTGIDITALLTILAIGFGALVGGAAIAFGLGSRNYVSNLIAAQQLAKTCRVGDKLRIGAQEGRILELTRTAVVLETEDGRATVPAGLFADQPSVALSEDKGDG